MLKRSPSSPAGTRVHCGVDISKKTFNWHCQGVDGECANDRQGFAQLLKQLKSTAGCNIKDLHIVLESTGGYEVPLRHYLHGKAIPLTMANPARVRAFAQSRGLAKTDRIDARAIALYAGSFPAAEPLRATPPPAREHLLLGALCDARNQLVKIRTMISNQMEHLEGAALARHRKVHASLEKQIQGYAQDIKAHLLAWPRLKVVSDLLQEVKGVGLLGAAMLMAHLPELGTLNRGECARLAGLAPVNADSGTKVGHRKVKGGRSAVRCALFMGCRSAVRFNAVLRAFYEQLKARGKCDKVAITAVMRKMLVHLNSKMKKHLEKTADAPA